MIDRILQAIKKMMIGAKGNKKVSVTPLGAYTVLTIGEGEDRYILRVNEAEQLVGELSKTITGIKSKYKLRGGGGNV